MAETMRKDTLLATIQNEYERLEALLSSLSEQQITAMQVNGTWSVKDTLAHLTTWQGYLLDQLQGVVSGKQPPAFMPELATEDEINERVYQVHKDRPLAEVLAEFHTSFAHILETIKAMSEETLNATFPWRQDSRLVWNLIAHNTYLHYQEHADTIQRWLGNAR